MEGEDAPDLITRRQQAAYENHFQDIIKRREALVYSRNVQRQITANSWEEIRADVDREGTPWEQFARKAFRGVQKYGFQPVLTDRPFQENSPLTRLQEEAARDYPYAKLIDPRSFVNWKLGADGKLAWCVIEHNSDLKRLITRDMILVYERNKRNEWILKEAVEHGVGKVPVIILNDLDPEQGSIVGKPSLYDPVDLSILLFNMQSWYTHMLYKTNFSSLAMSPNAGSDEEREVKIGPSYALWVPEGGITPEWVSPGTGPADVFERRIKDARRRIYELAELDAGLGEDVARDLSGEAYDRRHSMMQNSAVRMARRMQEFEIDLATLLLIDWQRETAKIEVKYPRRYGVRSTTEAAKQLREIEQSESLPPDVIALIASNIVYTNDFAELSDEEQRKTAERIKSYNYKQEKKQTTIDVEEARIKAEEANKKSLLEF